MESATWYSYDYVRTYSHYFTAACVNTNKDRKRVEFRIAQSTNQPSKSFWHSLCFNSDSTYITSIHTHLGYHITSHHIHHPSIPHSINPSPSSKSKPSHPRSTQKPLSKRTSRPLPTHIITRLHRRRTIKTR